MVRESRARHGGRAERLWAALAPGWVPRTERGGEIIEIHPIFIYFPPFSFDLQLPRLVSLLLPDLEVPKGNQALGLLGATLSGALAGSLCGHLLRSLRPSVDLAFSDEVRWACSEDLPRGVLSL